MVEDGTGTIAEQDGGPAAGRRARVRRLEVGLALGLWGLAFAVLAVLAGGPITWDELLYLSQSVRPEPEGYILNRYFHVYFQKLFVELSGDALLGARLFWAFLVSWTWLATYLLARLVSGSRAAGVAAAVFFAAAPLVFFWNGVTYADFTAMALVAAACVLALVANRAHARGSWTAVFALLGLGAVVALGLKSKESALPAVLLFAGVARPGLGRALLDLGLVALGGVAGLVLLGALDAAYLGDALFQVRAENLRACLAFNQERELQRTGEHWFMFVGSTTLFFPFLLHVATGRAAREEGPPATRWIWALPFALLLFLTLTMVSGNWGVEVRYVLPALPLVCAFAGVHFRDLGALERRWAAVVACGVGVALALVLLPMGTAYAERFGWKEARFATAIVYPAGACLFLAACAGRRRWRLATLVLGAVALTAVLGRALADNVEALASGDGAERSARRFAPLAAFREELGAADGAVVFVSQSVFADYRMLGRNDRASGWMLTVATNGAVRPQRLVQSGEPRDALEPGVELALLTPGDLARLGPSAALREAFRFERKSVGEGAIVVLLRRRES